MTMTVMKVTAMVATAALALGACKPEGGAGVATPGTQQGKRVTSPAIAELLAAVPGNAVGVGFLDLEEPPWALVTGGGGPMTLDEASRKTLDKELRAHLDRTLGLDVSRLQYAVGFVSGPPMHGAVLLKTVRGTLKMPEASAFEGGKVWAIDAERNLSLAIRGEIVAFGEDAAVREALETMAGKRKPVTQDNKALVEWLQKETAGAAIAVAAIRPTALPLPPPIAGLERMVLAIDGRAMTAAVVGDDAAITALQAKADEGLAMMLAEVEKAHAAAVTGTLGPLEGAMAIIGAAYARSNAAKIKPQRRGNRLSVAMDHGLGGASSTMLLAGAGVMSAVAIPAFMDYMKRSKKTEASLQLNKLGKNAKRVYFETGKFPIGAAPLTPPTSCCGEPTHHCAAVPALYAGDPTWAALDFQIDEPTLFQYSYKASADGQSFVAEAVGDLDCDGTFMTYELAGTAPGGQPTITLTEPAPNTD